MSHLLFRPGAPETVEQTQSVVAGQYLPAIY